MRVLTFNDLRSLGIAFSRKHLDAMMRDGKFPLAFPISPRRLVWSEAEIIKWLDAKATQPRQPAPCRRSPTATAQPIARRPLAVATPPIARRPLISQ
jgi:predicted DNA-binding transcriptional regulator AlpA